MAVSSYSLIEKIKSKIFDSNISSIELAQLSSIIEKLNQSDITVASLSDLPSPQDNQGRFFYVEDIDDFRYSDGENWVREYRSTIILHDLLFSWGENSLGTLGDATNTNRSSPVSVSGGFTDWCAFSQSGATTFGGTLGIRSNGTLWGWGNSGNGQLGFFCSSPGQATPLQVTTASNWCAACTIGSSSLFLNCNGILWSSGSHSTGDTGLNLNSGQTNSPLSIVGGITDWCKITKNISHSLALRSDNSLWSWGNNIYGRLGDGSTTNRSSPVSVNAVFGDNDWNTISLYNTHAIALKNNGTLWAWGNNTFGQFGNSTVISSCSPVNISQSTDWCAISAGWGHTAAIKTDCTLWLWGSNNVGQLGDDTVICRSSPVSVVGGFTDWCQVSAGNTFSAAIRTNGTLWLWGSNNVGQLGDDTVICRSSPVSVVGGFTDWCRVRVGQNSTFAIKTDCTLWAWGCNNQGQLGNGTNTNRSSPASVVGGFNDWCAVSVGPSFTAAIRTNCTLWTWGGNFQGQLGNSLPNSSSPVSVVGGFTDWCQVSAGSNRAAAIRTNGTLWAWGYNCSGELGSNTVTTCHSPVSAVGGFTDWCLVNAAGSTVAAIRTNGTIWTWGQNLNGLAGQNALTTIESPIKADDYFSDWTNIIGSFGKPSIVGLRSNGTIWSWGYLPEGRKTFVGKRVDSPLSLPGDINDWVTFDNSGNYGVAAIRSDGTLWAWGRNNQGHLGDGTTIDRSSPVSVLGGFTDWIQIGKGKNFSAGLRSNGSIWTWGSNGQGQLGDENIAIFCRSSPVMVGGGFSDWCFISAASYNVHAIRTDGTLWAWGQNFQGKLGDGTSISRSSPVSVVGGFTDWCTVSSSNSVIAAIRTNGTLWTWGSNGAGQLGDDTIICRSSPVSVVGGFTDWCKVSVSSNHTAAIRTDGTLWTWGCGGQLGDGTKLNRSSPVSVLGEYCDWYNVTAIRGSTIAIRSPGEMWVWGDNGCGELMSSCIDVLRSSPVSIAGNTVDWSVISAGCAHTAAIRANGELLTWGINKFGLLGRNTDSFQNKTSPTKIYKISSDWCILAAGHCSTAAIRTNGTLWTWGHNKYGMLGQDSATTLANINLVVGGFSDWCDVSVGTVHTAAIRTDGTLWTWGRNISGILGVNDGNICRSSPVSVVGGFTDWCKVSANTGFTAAIRTNGTIWTWGRGIEGQLGNDGAAAASSPVSVVGGFTDWCTVSAGRYHNAAIRTNGTLWTWGSGSEGKLGDDTIICRSSPVSVVGGFTDWCAVCLGSTHSIAIRTNGTIWSWGDNTSGRLGIEANYGNRSSPVSVVGGFTDWCSISARGNHSVAMRTDGTIWAWGSNNAGQLGDGTCINRSSPVSILSTNLDWNMISAAGCQTFAIDVNNNIYSWGANYHGQLGIEDLNNLSPVNNIQVYNDWCTVSSGYCHIAAIRTNGTLWTWGSNDRGQIGDGTNICRSSPVSVVGGFTDWCTVSATIGSFNAAIRTNGTLWAWGNNASSSLGDGTVICRSSPVSVLGGYCDWCAVSGRTALRRKQYKGFN